MNHYQKTLIVSHDDLDDLNHVNNVRYLQWVQDISKEHWQKSATKEMVQNMVWVVMNHNICYKNAALLGDQIVIKTHIAESRGAKSIRNVEMFNAKTNKILLHAKTEWCLLNAETLKPIRIPQEVEAIFSEV